MKENGVYHVCCGGKRLFCKFVRFGYWSFIEKQKGNLYILKFLKKKTGNNRFISCKTISELQKTEKEGGG